jgi:hypothetical protein
MDLNAESLKVIDDDGKNDNSQEQAHDVESLSLQKTSCSARPLSCHANRDTWQTFQTRLADVVHQEE